MVTRKIVVMCTALLSFIPITHGAEERLVIDTEKTRVSFSLDSTLHMVHGTMLINAGHVIFDLETGHASGTITLDATSAETGNKKRDKKMHTSVLESHEFSKITFTPDRVEIIGGTAQEQTINLHGDISIHGSRHPLSLKATVQRQGEKLSGTCSFQVPFVQWGMKDPSVFVLRTDKHVDITLEIHGKVTRTDSPL